MNIPNKRLGFNAQEYCVNCFHIFRNYTTNANNKCKNNREKERYYLNK